MVAHILKTTLHLPNRIQAICWIQFWSWIGEKYTIAYALAVDANASFRLVPLPVL